MKFNSNKSRVYNGISDNLKRNMQDMFRLLEASKTRPGDLNFSEVIQFLAIMRIPLVDWFLLWDMLQRN